jgi:hypothetical protein
MNEDGFIPVKTHYKKSRKQRQRKPVPAPVVQEDDWQQRLELWQGKGDDSAWFQPAERLSEDKVGEHQSRVDRLKDLVPFWRNNVDAAERGEPMAKYADFLDRVFTEEDEWTAGDSWGAAGANWGMPKNEWGALNGGGWDSGNHDGWGPVDDGGWVAPEAVKADEWATNNDKDAGWGDQAWESYDPWGPGKWQQNLWTGAPASTGDRNSNIMGKHEGVRSQTKVAGQTAKRRGASRSWQKGKQQSVSVFPWQCVPCTLTVVHRRRREVSSETILEVHESLLRLAMLL